MNGAGDQGLAWLPFTLLTVAMWGLYGVLLHAGQLAMSDAVNGRYKAFFWVGIAYFLTAVLAPAAMLIARGASWQMPGGGITWSLLAGIAGAVGAFGVLLAFGAKGTPSVVMSIVFAGAPVINAVVATIMHPPAGGWKSVQWPFVLGLVLAAGGGALVTLYRPMPAPKAKPTASAPGSVLRSAPAPGSADHGPR
jgi:hypothetical protein